MIKEIFEETPQLGERCDDFVADRGLDSGETKVKLFDEYGIRPGIDIRELWRDEKNEPGYDPAKPITRPLYPDRAIPLCIRRKGQSIAFVQLQRTSEIWFFVALKKIAMP